MVLYFSGTGNSKCIAERIAHNLSDSLYSINDGIRNNTYPDISEEETLIFCTPTYAWRFPRVVNIWVKATQNNTQIFADKKAYFIMTCASTIGSSEDYDRELCGKVKMTFMGCAQVRMPENYITRYDCPSEEDSVMIVKRALEQVDAICPVIAAGEHLPVIKAPVKEVLLSVCANPVYYTFCSKGRQFYVTSKCDGCGKCAMNCPLGNIFMRKGKPLWSNHCTNCMACICGCPKEAIEFGDKTKGKRRYHCPDISEITDTE